MTVTILRIRAVAKKLGISVSKLYDMINPNSPRFRDDFPRRVRIGANAVGFIEQEVDSWLLSQQEP